MVIAAIIGLSSAAVAWALAWSYVRSVDSALRAAETIAKLNASNSVLEYRQLARESRTGPEQVTPPIEPEGSSDGTLSAEALTELRSRL